MLYSLSFSELLRETENPQTQWFDINISLLPIQITVSGGQKGGSAPGGPSGIQAPSIGSPTLRQLLGVLSVQLEDGEKTESV